MMNHPQIKRMLSKLTQLEATLDRYVFQKQDELSVVKYETKEQLYAAPADEALYSKVQQGDVWGAELSYCWFKGSFHRSGGACRKTALHLSPLWQL